MSLSHVCLKVAPLYVSLAANSATERFAASVNVHVSDEVVAIAELAFADATNDLLTGVELEVFTERVACL